VVRYRDKLEDRERVLGLEPNSEVGRWWDSCMHRTCRGASLLFESRYGSTEPKSPHQKVSQNQKDIADLMNRLQSAASMLRESADYALSPDAERDMNEFLKYATLCDNSRPLITQ
jgi:hypothetical protein